jgi:hypothetical protein
VQCFSASVPQHLELKVISPYLSVILSLVFSPALSSHWLVLLLLLLLCCLCFFMLSDGCVA